MDYFFISTKSKTIIQNNNIKKIIYIRLNIDNGKGNAKYIKIVSWVADYNCNENNGYACK